MPTKINTRGFRNNQGEMSAECTLLSINIFTTSVSGRSTKEVYANIVVSGMETFTIPFTDVIFVTCDPDIQENIATIYAKQASVKGEYHVSVEVQIPDHKAYNKVVHRL